MEFLQEVCIPLYLAHGQHSVEVQRAPVTLELVQSTQSFEPISFDTSSTLVVCCVGLSAAATNELAASMGIVYTIASVRYATVQVGASTITACSPAILRSFPSIVYLQAEMGLQSKKSAVRKIQEKYLQNLGGDFASPNCKKQVINAMC